MFSLFTVIYCCENLFPYFFFKRKISLHSKPYPIPPSRKKNEITHTLTRRTKKKKKKKHAKKLWLRCLYTWKLLDKECCLYHYIYLYAVGRTRAASWRIKYCIRLFSSVILLPPRAATHQQ